MKALREDFLNNLNTFIGTNLTLPELDKEYEFTNAELKELIGGTSGEWYQTLNLKFAAMSVEQANTFVKDDAMWAKWSWMFEYMNIYLTPVGSAMNMAKRIVVISPPNWTYILWGFLTESPLISGWPSSKVDWSNGVAAGCLRFTFA